MFCSVYGALGAWGVKVLRLSGVEPSGALGALSGSTLKPKP